MVFANFTEEDKQAFFALLDEYFASRTELAQALGLSKVNMKAKASPLASNPEIASAVGRVAAAFNANNNTSTGLRPTPPVRRASASTAHDRVMSEPSPPPPPRAPPRPGAPDALTTQRKMGDVDLSSPKNMLWSLRNKEAPAPELAPVPAAFPKPKGFAPPPSRRSVPAPPVRAQTPEPEPEEEEQGEWAEALYDYSSSDPNDLPLRENQRVLVTARTSEDWWTGEVDGKSGLFPATYVKIL